MNVRRIGFEPPEAHPHADEHDPETMSVPLTAREWLVTNGLGGYAAGTISGVITRRFHGLLIAALPAPLARTMVLNHLSDMVCFPDGASLQLSAQTDPDEKTAPALMALTEFRLEDGLPVWRYAYRDYVIEKRVLLPHRQNTVHVSYLLVEGPDAVRLELEPWLNFRPHEGAVDQYPSGAYTLNVQGEHYEVAGEHLPPLRLHVADGDTCFHIEGKRIRNLRYQIEKSRGYDYCGDLYTPGLFQARLEPGRETTFIASTEGWRTVHALSPADARRLERERRRRLIAQALPEARTGLAEELVYAADQFLIAPVGRVEEWARALAVADEVRTVIAGYYWFTDWGRDTMISLEGLTLVTGRWAEAGFILRTFAGYVRDGLIPNMIPEGQNAGLYHTADATLWFFHAVDRYVRVTGDRATLEQILPVLSEVIRRHWDGTRFGIGVDPADGLLRQGQEGYQLTWMDAKVGDLVVTPRRGKAVEINALFYNALRLMAGWHREAGDAAFAGELDGHAERAKAAFNRRFWYEPGGYLYDVVDSLAGGDDASFRPNQILAVSLAHPVLEPSRWQPVVEKVREKLLTPVGLRSLAPDHPDYKPHYFGDLYTRDNAYHQGTVWGWLIGPFVDAWLKVHPDRKAEARAMLAGAAEHLNEACAGSVSEIFDAEPPFTPRGCVAQAWSVAELLRCLVMTHE